MAELTKEAACREIAERHGLTITHITDDDFEPRVVKNPDPNALAALREACDWQREQDALIAENAVIPESFRKASMYTEFERGGDNYLTMIASAIRRGGKP